MISTFCYMNSWTPTSLHNRYYKQCVICNCYSDSIDKIFKFAYKPYECDKMNILLSLICYGNYAMFIFKLVLSTFTISGMADFACSDMSYV